MYDGFAYAHALMIVDSDRRGTGQEKYVRSDGPSSFVMRKEQTFNFCLDHHFPLTLTCRRVVYSFIE